MEEQDDGMITGYMRYDGKGLLTQTALSFPVPIFS